MYYILERGGEKNMKKRWFVVILTIGLLLHVLPLSVLALSPDPTITDADGTILDWSDLSTVSDVLDDSQKQNSAVVDAKSGTDAPGLAETGPGKSLADADNDEEAADDRPTVNLTPKTPDEESGGDDPADADRDKAATDDLPAGNPTPKTLDKGPGDDDLADADRDEAAADDLSVANPTPQPLDEETDDDDPADDADSTTAPAVCKIDKIDDTYYYSTLDDAITAATDDDQIDLLTDIEQDTGLTFTGKTLTISGGGTHTLTLNQNGMYASHSDITFKDLTLNIYAHTHTHEGGAGGTANLISNSNLRLNNVNFTLIPDGSCGSGIYLYQKSNLYLDGSYAVIRGVSNYRASGIYADDSEFKGQPNREIKINNSYLEITGCAHAAMTIDPIDITLSSSNVVVMDNGKSDPDGYGFGIGCYGGKLTMESSTLTATGNTGAWYGYAVFVDGLDVDSGSTLDIRDNGGSGLGVGGIGVIQGGSQVICDGNGTNDPGYGSGGLYVYAGADLTIESGANVSVCQNKGLAAIVNSCKLHIQNGANVSVDNNAKLGIYNSYDSYLTIESGANVTANHNGAHGIYNQVMGDLKQGAFLIESGANVTANYNTVSGIVNCNLFTVEKGANLQVEYNSNCGIQNDEHATLNLLAGSVRYNHAGSVGGGLVNSGTAILSDDVELYNNHATSAGDDIYNANGATITFGPTGRGWELDGEPDCYDFITGWYDDSETTRWNAHEGGEADLHMDLVAPVASYTGPLSLKAAHGSTGSLTVCKETLGDLLPSDYDTVFTFELTLDDDAITTINDKWCGVPFKNGKASFTLKSGESITLSNLPAGIGYTITETAQDGWTLLNLNPAETGVVPQNDTAKVVFTNLKNSPDDPDVPVVPVDPEEPEIPEKPEGPETPEEPEGPETPEEPEGPETPEEPEEPEIPEETEETEAPGELPAEEPAQTDTSASLAQPEETPTQNTTTVTLIQTGTTDWLAAVLLIFGIGLLVCGWFFDRKQRAAKH